MKTLINKQDIELIIGFIVIVLVASNAQGIVEAAINLSRSI